MFRLLFPPSLAAAAVAFSLATAAHALAPERTTRLGSRIPISVGEPETASQQEASRTLQRFARCLVDRRPDLAAAIVDQPHSSDNVVRLANFRRAQRPMSQCMTPGGRMSGEQRLLTGAFAEHLYRGRFPALPQLAPAAPLSGVTDPDDGPFVATVAFVNCLIDLSPGPVDALARSSVGSDHEEAAYGALAGKYGECLDDGDRLVISRVALRTAMADQLYRRAQAAAASLARAAGDAR